jgi:GTP cyclohydrolase II
MAIVSQTILNLKYGQYKTSYHRVRSGTCVSFVCGDVSKKTPIVRIHSACLFGEAFFSYHCDCGQQLEQTMQKIKKHGCGVIVYSYDEGRGIGLEKKIKSMGIENTDGLNTLEAFKKLGFKKHDYRNYKKEVQALKDLHLKKEIWLVSNNPQKVKALETGGFLIKKFIKLKIKINNYNKGELLLKKSHLNYYID